MDVAYTTTQLVDQSTGDIVNWQWDFGDDFFESVPSPYHTYENSIALYEVNLIITNSDGCLDTAFRHVQIVEGYIVGYSGYGMYIPNSFTPDLDDRNDKFCIGYDAILPETFTFNLYSRFSELVYSTNNINELKCIYDGGSLVNGWDGKHYKTGNDVPMGVYIYEVYFRDSQSGKHQDRGQLFLIR